MTAWKNVQCPDCFEIFSAGDLICCKGLVICPCCHLSFPITSFKVIE